MRATPILVLPALLAGLACRRAEVEAFRQSPRPVVVSFEIPKDVPDREEVAKEYAAVLRNRLATRLVVVPEGVEPPADAAHLKVIIESMEPGSREATPAQVGVATGVTVGVVSGMLGNRHAAWSGFWWGMFAGHQAAREQRESDRLGFRPLRMEARLLMTQGSSKDPVIDRDLEPREIINAMDGLRRSEEDDPIAVREAEARGLARVIIRALDDELGLRAGEPRWYGVKAEEERPGPEPKRDSTGQEGGGTPTSTEPKKD
jgi:hypothetical protein